MKKQTQFISLRKKAKKHLSLNWNKSICTVLSSLTIALSLSFAPVSQTVLAETASIKVALLINPGTEASEFRKELRNNDDENITYKIIHNSDLRDGSLKDYQALIIPGGSATTESNTMGPEAREEIKRFIKDGGIYLGVCAGAYLASSLKQVYLGLLPIKTNDSEHWWRTDGAPKLLVELTPAGQEIFGVQSKFVRIAYENGPVFSPPFAKTDDSFTPLGYFREEVVGDGGKAGVMLGAPAIIYSRYGKGSILVISPHPEESPGLKQVELHAIRWLYEHRNSNLSEIPNRERAGENITLVKHSAPETHTDLRSSTLQANAAEGTKNREREENLDHNREGARKDEQKENVAAQRDGERGLASERRQDADTNRSATEDSAGETLGQRALHLAESVFDRATVVRYSHHEVPAARQITADAGDDLEALTDCSGFISYLVHTVAPRHYTVVRSREPGHAYPQAKVWANFFTEMDGDQAHDGWIRIRRWRDLKPGDIIAWKQGKAKAGGNTGHVMMVKTTPTAIQESNGYRYIEVSVIDASSVYHFAPEQLPPRAHQKHRNGLGIGCIRIVLSNDDTPIGYWEGSYWGEGEKEITHPTMSNVIGFGRMVHLEDNDQSTR